MGLDMYLKKAKRIGDVSPSDIYTIDSYLDWKDSVNHEKTFCSFTDWCGIKESDVNIDLANEYKKEFVERFASWDSEKRYGWKTISETVGDWRKANAVHSWFVNNVQNSIDDCGTYEVTEEDLNNLLDICTKIKLGSVLVDGKIKNGYTFENGEEHINYQDGKYIEDPSLAQELLPTTSGFFFGSTEYDQWYMMDIEKTIEIITKVLDETDFEHEIVMYSSSW